jgi:hypothetical protein
VEDKVNIIIGVVRSAVPSIQESWKLDFNKKSIDRGINNETVNSQKTIVDISAAVSIKVAKQPKYLM